MRFASLLVCASFGCNGSKHRVTAETASTESPAIADAAATPDAASPRLPTDAGPRSLAPGRDRAIEIAREAASRRVTIPPDAPVDVTVQGGSYVVTFKTQLPAGMRGPDYYARVTIDRASGAVLEILGGS